MSRSINTDLRSTVFVIKLMSRSINIDLRSTVLVIKLMLRSINIDLINIGGAQWLSALLETKGPWVQASLRCVREEDTLILA